MSRLFKTGPLRAPTFSGMHTLFDQSVPVLVRGLWSLRQILRKAEAHALAQGSPPDALLSARLADDMNDLAIQAHWVIAGAKLAVDRILGDAGPPDAEAKRSFAEIAAFLEATATTLAAIDPETLERRRDVPIVLPIGGATKTFAADAFLAEFAIPNLYFHLVTAYAILRHEGVPLQKADYFVR